jgi:ligand-binding SRPBCC domain-containing protein
MIFRHRFDVRAPLEEVAAFHRAPETLGAITPLLRVEVERRRAPLDEGDELDMMIRLGPLSMPWRARIEGLSAVGFVDRQLSGPFRLWVHRHGFVPLGANSTLVLDEVRAIPRRHPIWGPLGLGMWLSLPLLFAYRAWQTRRLLERRSGRMPSGLRAR